MAASSVGLQVSLPLCAALLVALPGCGWLFRNNKKIPSLRPPREEIPPTFWEQHGWWWVVVLAVLSLALIGAALWFLRRPKPLPIVPPDVQARRALEPLRQQAENGLVLSRVSQILRHYVAAAFALPPEEMNTTEFCRAIACHQQLGPQLAIDVEDFLRQCDVCKFAPVRDALVSPAGKQGAVEYALVLIGRAEARKSAVSLSAAQPAGNLEIPS